MNGIEETINYHKKEIKELEEYIKKCMDELNNDVQNSDFSNTRKRNWGFAKEFQKIQYALMQLENEKGQLEALELLLD